MFNEIRGLDVSNLEEFEINENMILGIGTEGCVHKFCKDADELLEKNEKNQVLSKAQIRIITPRIPAKYMDIVTDCIIRLVEVADVEAIVINDYGLMYRLYHNVKIKVPFILGRTLIRSLEYVPWNEYLLRDEKEEIKDIVVFPNIIHKEKIELFKKYKVIGVELCPTKVNRKSIACLHAVGMKVYIHYDSIIATVGRTCPVARMNNKKIGNCYELCQEVLEIKVNRVWGASQFLFMEPSQTAKQMIPQYKCIGNVMYHNQTVDKEFPFRESDGVIYDYKLNEKKEILNLMR